MSETGVCASFKIEMRNLEQHTCKSTPQLHSMEGGSQQRSLRLHQSRSFCIAALLEYYPDSPQGHFRVVQYCKYDNHGT